MFEKQTRNGHETDLDIIIVIATFKRISAALVRYLQLVH